MQHKPLQYVLKSHFVLDPRRTDFIAAFILALLKVRTVNLTQTGTALNGLAQPSSNARRSKRFLKYDLGQELIAKFVLSFNETQKLILVMDRTNWKFGAISINFLVIAIAFGGIAIPVAWKNLGKEGNSNQAERKIILETLLKIIPAHRILALTADREFIGQDWFKALFEQEVNPVIRLKLDTMIQHRGIKARADVWFDHLKPGEILELTKARVMGVRVFVLATLTPEGEFLILATRKRPSQALIIYAQRWEREQPARCCLVSKKIETLFAAFKTRGFNLEDTHITNLERSERLFALLVIALAWVVLVGEFVSSKKQLKLKNHGSPERSVFRVGLDCLRQILLSGRSGKLVLDDVVPLLSSS